jgi:hypothetical protein
VKVTYLRSQLSSQPANVKDRIDPPFINDQYWLVFPFHVVWDASAAVEDAGMHKLPLGKGSAELVRDLNRSSRDGGRQAVPAHFFECVRQARGLKQLAERAINMGEARSWQAGRSLAARIGVFKMRSLCC